MHVCTGQCAWLWAAALAGTHDGCQNAFQCYYFCNVHGVGMQEKTVQEHIVGYRVWGL